MEVFLLAAGLGTRLRPLTDHCPKALVTVNGLSLLEINIRNLVKQGATRIVVNVHHFADQIVEFVSRHEWGCEVLISDERELLLDTGGGLKHAEHLFSGKVPIVIHNVDILSRLPIQKMVDKHLANSHIATLAVSQRNTSRRLLFGADEALVGWKNESSGEYLWVDKPLAEFNSLAFSGIAVIEPTIFSLLPAADHPYPIIPAYLQIAKCHAIRAFEHKAEHWLDVGKPETLKQAETFFIN